MKTMLSYLKTIQTILMTFLAGSQVSDRCFLHYLFVIVSSSLSTSKEANYRLNISTSCTGIHKTNASIFNFSAGARDLISET